MAVSMKLLMAIFFGWIMKNLIFKVLFCICFIMPTVNAQQPAEKLPMADQSLMLSVTKVGNDIVMVGERGHVLKSTDGGQSWRQVDDIPVNVALTKVVSKGNKIWAVGHDATIIHSSDAGETWELQFYDADREVPLLSAYFANENVGFVIGAYGTLLKTDDAGTTWQDELISEELDYHLNDITRGDDGNYYIAAEAGYFFRSLDGGETWEDIELPYMGSMFGVNTIGDEIVLFGLRGNILSSNDQGMTWSEIQAEEPNNIFGSTPLSSNSLLLVGANGSRLVYQNNSLSVFPGADSGDDYADAIVSGDQVLLVGETGFKFQSNTK